MKQINKKWLVVIILTAVISTSCKKNFLDVNNDPNRVTDDNVTAELIFTQAENAVGARQASGNFGFLERWMGYFASNGDFARDNTETSYNIDFGFGDALFQNHYNTLFDLHQAELKGLTTKDTVLSGAAIILSAKLYQELVDLYGNIPYSQAFKIDKYSRPGYDKAQDVYNFLQLRLDTAISYMKLKASKSFTVAVDIINKADQTKWIKFANTLKLRLLIRQSEISGFSPVAEIKKIIDNGGVLGAGESISVNPGYVNDVNKQSPFYANYGFDPTGVKANTSTSANQYILDILQGTNDARIDKFFAPVGNSFVGNIYGDEPGNLNVGGSSSYFGSKLIGSATQDQWIFPSYESLFLKAEAVARGWIAGDEKLTYEAAVKESFVWLGVDSADRDANDYLTSNPSAGWANSGSTALSKAKFIAFQKYIANTGVDPLESYSDQRRLNFLTNNAYISVNPGAVSNKLPLRLLYPQSEYTTNSENVLAQGTINALTTKLFWEP